MKSKLLIKGVAAFLLTFFVSGVSAQNVTEEVVPLPEVKTLTTDETKEGDITTFVYSGNLAVRIEAPINEADNTRAVSGMIYKWSTTKTYTKKDFEEMSVENATATTRRRTIATLEGKSVDYYLTVIAYKNDGTGKRVFSDVITRKYVYEDKGKAVTTLSLAQSPITIDMTQAGATGSVSTTITATSAGTEVSGLEYTAYCNNDEITEASTNGSNLEVTGKGIYGSARVMVVTKGNATHKPAFIMVNTIVKTDVPVTQKGKIYTSIAEFRAAGEKDINPTTNDNNKTPCILQFTKENPATVIAQFKIDNKKAAAKSIFIVDRSGYGLMVRYGKDKSNFFIDKNNLTTGSTFTGTIACAYNQRESQIPEMSSFPYNSSGELEPIKGLDGNNYSVNIEVDNSGAIANVKNPSIRVMDVDKIYTINHNIPAKDEKPHYPSNYSFGSFINTIISIPGTIQKRTTGEYVLVQEGMDLKDDNYAMTLDGTQIGINLENYIGLKGIFKGLV